ncbi:head decoration protein [Spartinivicinus poritis]|uniref:Head decoration protein n=1 Tax=Spartinivicinus poritis TaxID=2994640 RepID=A0ABT5UIA3_9GAMM|nr:head decoration protein [Spartinivicinus sp. A2-2]MDE1465930.1 head decoration protein [Spartinivicinus sp. A2-2]
MITEPRHFGEYILKEMDGFSRADRMVTGGLYPVATVLGEITETKQLTALNPTATDGSQKAVAILMGMVDARTEPQNTVVTDTLTVVRKVALEWPAEITDEQKQTALAELKEKFIIAR